ncbi:uncharacterized protein LACBIDRAFT_299694 [Laccaria bicolor S238N-H82]|uniref:Predicted protein n=1 Tax=Laccaria bicolor (strain S238N-H82 / ATCC MYA-4686) TaxID=486041 RepID=B0DF70_LACBS|nr:uncharacterized protein LACBIDRAFT_299694 [Laccaria bicolor S238N-H82]EDR06805.1 predicted protein [Laccaria bicolor S238N-H82]|eukprot:XP_001882652.1 predicted protein [Laccaria bicolor S238N-H82]
MPPTESIGCFEYQLKLRDFIAIDAVLQNRKQNFPFRSPSASNPSSRPLSNANPPRSRTASSSSTWSARRRDLKPSARRHHAFTGRQEYIVDLYGSPCRRVVRPHPLIATSSPKVPVLPPNPPSCPFLCPPHVLALPHHPDTQSTLDAIALTLVDKRLIVRLYGKYRNSPCQRVVCPHPLKPTSPSPSLAKPSSPPPIGLLTNAILSNVVAIRVVSDFSASQSSTLPKPRSRAV